MGANDVKRTLELNHPLWRMLSFLSDCMILTIIWFIFSLPILTIGPSTVALLHTTAKIIEKKENGVIRDFTTTFFLNLKKSIITSNVILMMGVLLVINLVFYQQSQSDFAVFMVLVFILLTILYSGISLYAFPLLSYKGWRIKQVMKVSFYMTLSHLKWTLFMLTINGSLLFTTLYVAPYISFFVVGFLAYVNMKVVLTLLKENDYSPLIL